MKKSTKMAIENLDYNDPDYQYMEAGIKMLSKNGYEIGEYNPHCVSAWLIINDHVVGIAIGSSEQEAIDSIVDAGGWDSLKMSDEDYREYDYEGWTDSYIYAGNASEAFWSENLSIKKLVQA